MITSVSLAAKLRRLGSSPSLIAIELLRRGIKGNSNCYACPIANFLSQSTKGINYVAVSPYYATVGIGVGTGTVFVRAPMPVACKQFVSNFDRNEGHSYLRAKTREEIKACNPLAADPDYPGLEGL